MTCTCKDWLKNIDKLNAPWMLSLVHGCIGYDGRIFKYCPWCGKKLKNADNEKV